MSMFERITSNNPITKAVRIVLVFSLVFWVSFRAESLAFAEMTYRDSAPEGHVLAGLTVHEVSASSSGEWELGRALRSIAETSREDALPTVSLSADGGSMMLVAVPDWAADPGAGQQGEGGEGGEGGTTGDDPQGGEGGEPGSDTPSEDDGSGSGTGSSGEDGGGSAGGEGDQGGEPASSGEDDASGDASSANSYEPNAAENASQANEQSASRTRGTVAVQADDDADGDTPLRDFEIARFATWSVEPLPDDDHPQGGAAKIQTDDNGVATLAAERPGKVEVTCSIPASFDAVADDLEGTKATFEVELLAAKAHVAGITLFQPPYSEEQGVRGIDSDNDVVTLTDDERASYAFWAKVSIADDQGNELMVCSLNTGDSLVEQSDGLIDENLEWSLEAPEGQEFDREVASIDKDTGTFSLTGSGPVVVVCTSHRGLDDNEVRASVTVKASDAEPKEDDKPNIQGDERYRQDSLTVTIEKPVSATASGSEAAQQDGGDASGTSTEQGGDGAGTTQDESGDGTDATQAGSADGAATERVSKTYSPEQIEEIGTSSGTYTMDAPEGQLVVDGYGTSLSALLDNAGIGINGTAGEQGLQENIETVDFVDYADTSVSVPWSDLVAVSGNAAGTGDLSIMVALASRVHENAAGQEEEDETTRGAGSPVGTQDADDDESGDANEGHYQDDADADGGARDDGGNDDDPAGGGTDESGDNQGDNQGGDTTDPDTPSSDNSNPDNTNSDNTGAPSESGSSSGDGELLDTTRFRILYHGSIASVPDPDSLRYVKEIVVHMKDEEKKLDKVDSTLGVWIDYVPVRYGETAFLTAIPVNVGRLTFAFQWERSVDDGVTWSEVGDEATQTLRVPTDDDHIGNLYRVWLITSEMDASGSPRKVCSDALVVDGEKYANTEPGDAGGDNRKRARITADDDFGVKLEYVPPVAGDYAVFTSYLFNDGNIDRSKTEYIWEQSSDGGSTWTIIDGETGPTFRWLTAPIVDSSDSSEGSEDDATLILVRVRAVAFTYDGTQKNAVSNACPLTVRVGDTGGGAADTSREDEIEDLLNDRGSDDYGPDIFDEWDDFDAWDDEDDWDDGGTVEVDEPSTGDDEATAEAPGRRYEVTEVSDLQVDPDVSAQIAAQQEAAHADAASKKPGYKWTEITSPTPDDVRNILADNPFAPFALPLGLGIAFAGGLERVLSFRRQL